MIKRMQLKPARVDKAFNSDTGWPDPTIAYYYSIVLIPVALPISIVLFSTVIKMLKASHYDDGDTYWAARQRMKLLILWSCVVILLEILCVLILILEYFKR